MHDCLITDTTVKKKKEMLVFGRMISFCKRDKKKKKQENPAKPSPSQSHRAFFLPAKVQ
jgi:hypothetical protein